MEIANFSIRQDQLEANHEKSFNELREAIQRGKKPERGKDHIPSSTPGELYSLSDTPLTLSSPSNPAVSGGNVSSLNIKDTQTPLFFLLPNVVGSAPSLAPVITSGRYNQIPVTSTIWSSPMPFTSGVSNNQIPKIYPNIHSPLFNPLPCPSYPPLQYQTMQQPMSYVSQL